jgi:hypothetical protein
MDHQVFLRQLFAFEQSSKDSMHKRMPTYIAPAQSFCPVLLSESSENAQISVRVSPFGRQKMVDAILVLEGITKLEINMKMIHDFDSFFSKRFSIPSHHKCLCNHD